MENLIKPHSYHSISANEALKILKTSPEGLSDFEARGRLDAIGKNKLPREKRFSYLKLFLSQFNSPLVLIILVAAFLSSLVGHTVDALFIVFVVFINTTVGFFQESKAEKALEKLSRSVKFYCKVIRQKAKKEILSENLTPGDIVELQEGDKIPADGRVIQSKWLKINEAALTGEWLGIKKENKILSKNIGISDQANMVFMGTIVEEGRGTFVVTATGIRTELGKISQLVKREKETKTPLQKKFARLSRQIGAAILAAIMVFAAIYILSGEDLYTVFITSIALIVSAIPEGLLPAVTVVLVLGMRRLARKKALVRKLNATEGMGAVSVICMDKTGTLTRGEMQVSHILAGAEDLLGKEAKSKSACVPGTEILGDRLKALEIAVLVNDAYIENPDDELSRWIVRGNPTTKALLLAGVNAGVNKKELEQNFSLLEEINFDSSRKYAANIYKIKKNKVAIYVLGAPEKIIEASKQISDNGTGLLISSREEKKLFKKVDELTGQGLRALACGYKEIALNEYNSLSSKVKNGHSDFLLQDLNLAGFITLKDFLRADVSGSVEVAKRAGIRPVIISGDHKNTTRSIMEELGADVKDKNILEGGDLEKLDDKQLKEKVKSVDIFARVVPEHKIRIVRALQSRGEVVAMVGDGVNDAPALKAADIGIAVGTGTDIAKEVADIVLLDNSFSIIIKAIEQGRLIKENVRRVVVYLLADDFSELFLFFFAIILRLPFPLYPIQILWINLVEDSFPDIALTTEKDAKGLMDGRPPEVGGPILNRDYKKFMLSVFLVSGLAAFSLFYFSWKFFGDLEKARTITFALIAFDSLTFSFIVRSFRQSVFNRHIFSNKILNYAVLASFLILVSGLYFPPFRKLLNAVPLELTDWGMIIAISLLELLFLEKFKLWFLKKKAKR
ncbi:cation-transporting P-type ATPase [bacterium]|nr:cation-transporting P-type ATPase [bacterium]